MAEKMQETEKIKEYGQSTIETAQKTNIEVVTIIGEIEGHDALSQNAKTTKYEHLIPRLIALDNDVEIGGILFVLNTIGGDVECGLAIAELIASLKTPTVSLVIGGSHSIGIPLAVSTNYSFIVPTATMLVHPVRITGTILGAPQTYYQFYQMQERIVDFICHHSSVKRCDFEKMMMAKENMAKDLGTVLVGKEAVEHKLINKVGGLKDAIKFLENQIQNDEK